MNIFLCVVATAVVWSVTIQPSHGNLVGMMESFMNEMMNTHLSQAGSMIKSMKGGNSFYAEKFSSSGGMSGGFSDRNSLMQEALSFMSQSDKHMANDFGHGVMDMMGKMQNQFRDSLGLRSAGDQDATLVKALKGMSKDEKDDAARFTELLVRASQNMPEGRGKSLRDFTKLLGKGLAGGIPNMPADDVDEDGDEEEDYSYNYEE